MTPTPHIDLDLGTSNALDFLVGTDPSDSTLPPAERPIRKLFHWTDDPACPLVLTMDWSSLESLLACNRSAEYKLVHSRTTHTKSALIFGAAFHSALECFYKRSPTDTAESLIVLGGRAIQAEYALHPPGVIDDYRTADYCFTCFSMYITQFFGETITPYIHEGKPLVEFTFVYPVGEMQVPVNIFHKWGAGKLSNDPARETAELEKYTGFIEAGTPEDIPDVWTLRCRIEWSGIVDVLMRMGDETTLRVCDHKTTSVLSDAFFNSFQISMQPVGYVAAMRAHFPDLDIKGFLLNCVACRKPTKTGISYESYRRPYDYTNEQCEEWKQDLLALIGELLHNLTSQNFPKKTNWCAGKYGACPYLDVCSAPASQRQMILNTGLYSDNTWKPSSV